MAVEDNSWGTQALRQRVVSKIDEAIQRSGWSTSGKSVDMENLVFQKTKTRDDYLGLAARFILHVREINTKKMQDPTAGQTGGGMQDPINALQTLASQGTRDTQLMGGPQSMQPIPAPNLLQTLNRPGQMGGQLGASMQGGQDMNQMSEQLQNQLQNQMANQMQAQVSSGQIAQLQQLQPQLQANLGIASQGPNVQGGPNQLQGQIPNQLQGQLSGQMSVNADNPMDTPKIESMESDENKPADERDHVENHDSCRGGDRGTYRGSGNRGRYNRNRGGNRHGKWRGNHRGNRGGYRRVYTSYTRGVSVKNNIQGVISQ